MDKASSPARSGQLVVSSTASNSRAALSASVVRVSKPVALASSEGAFIEKTLHYISSINGCVKSGLILSTNTKFPRRYIIAIRGMPAMTLEDFQNIRDTNDHIRDIVISTAEESIRIDVWRSGRQPDRKKKRKRPKDSVVTSCDLSSVDQRDRKCLRQLLLRLNAMPEIECQFEVRVDTSLPDYYKLDIHMLDRVSLLSLETVLHDCRAFVHGIEFDFPHSVIRIKCLKLAAPLQARKIMRIKNK